MIRIFIGTEPRQSIADKVLEHTVRKYATEPVEFHRMQNLDIDLSKPGLPKTGTGFSFYRFCIPRLAGYQGRAIYLDADMILFTDIAALWNTPFNGATVLATPGKLSVLLLDCDRLRWDVDQIIDGLAKGRYNYDQLMKEFCFLAPDELSYCLPAEWNSLDLYHEEHTKLLHYTHLQLQPWITDAHRLGYLWERELQDALQAGVVDAEELREAVAAGYVKPSLLRLLDGEPTTGLNQAGREEVERLRREAMLAKKELAEIKNGGSYRLAMKVHALVNRVRGASH